MTYEDSNYMTFVGDHFSPMNKLLLAEKLPPKSFSPISNFLMRVQDFGFWVPSSAQSLSGKGIDPI
jgi:hypothetical protein